MQIDRSQKEIQLRITTIITETGYPEKDDVCEASFKISHVNNFYTSLKMGQMSEIIERDWEHIT